MVGRSLLVLAVVLCASPALNSPIENRIPSFKNIFNSFRSNPIIPAPSTSKPANAQPATAGPTTAASVVVQKPLAAQGNQQDLKDSPLVGLVLAAQSAHAQGSDVFTGKAAKPDNFGVQSPSKSAVKKGNGKRKRRPAANQAGKRRPAANQPGKRRQGAGATGFNAAAIKQAQQAMRPASPFRMGAIKAGAPNRRRPGAKGKGKKKGNKKRPRPQVSAARRQMNQVMDRLFQDFSKVVEARVEPVQVKLASLAGRGNKIGKWAFVKARQTARRARAEGLAEEVEVITDITEEHEDVHEEEHEEVKHDVAAENETQNKDNLEGRTLEEEDEDHDDVVAHDDEDDEEVHDDAHLEEADDTKKTVVIQAAAPAVPAAKPEEIKQAIEKLAAAVQAHPDFELPNPNILPDDNKEFTAYVSDFEKEDKVNPAIISETPVGNIKPDGKIEYQLSLVEDDEDELIKAEEELLAEQDTAEDRAGRPSQKNGNHAAVKRNKKKQKVAMRRQINMQRNRDLKRENSLDYPSSPNAVLHGLSKISRVGNVRIKTNNRMRLISVPIKFGPLKLETTDDAEQALRNADVSIPSLFGVLRLSERNGKIVDAKVMSAYLRPRRAIVTLTRSSEFDVTHENRRRQMARVVTHFSHQMARLWNAQSLLPKILTTEFQRAFTQPDVIAQGSSDQQGSFMPEIIDALKTAKKPATVTKAQAAPSAVNEAAQQALEQPAQAETAVVQDAAPVAPEAAAVPAQDQAQPEPAKPVDPVEAVQAIARVKLANRSPSTHVV